MTALFMGLAGVMIMAGLAALWQSLRSAFAGTGVVYGGDVGSGLPERKALEAEKRTLLRSIKDIQFERELGKISEEDFQRLDKAYRRRAKRVLSLLDHDIEPYVRRAEVEVTDAMGDEDPGPYRRGRVAKKRRGKKGRAKRKAGLECPACGVSNDVDAVHCKACATRLAPLLCESCGTENDPDAKFCKSCAKPLLGGGDEEE